MFRMCCYATKSSKQTIIITNFAAAILFIILIIIIMLSIPEIANQILEKSTTNDFASSTLFFVGGKAVGKSTLINSFLDKNDPIRETLILEYSFGRKYNQKSRIDKNICHVWEYGGNIDMLKNVLLNVPVKGNFTYCIMVDLSKIRRIWNILDVAIKAIRELQLKNEHVEVIVIGSKYDQFKNYENEIKKLICTTLRSLALLNNYNLFFYSSKEPSTVKRAREIFHGVGFGNGYPVKERVTSLSKPLFIAKGTDTWENIGVVKSTFEEIKSRHLSIIPLEVEANVISATSRPPNTHAEPFIDVIVQSKLEELRNFASFDMSGSLKGISF